MLKRTRNSVVLILFGSLIAGVGCARPGVADPAPASYAVYAEYAKDSNKLMKNGLNRRVFNKVEAQAGTDIALGGDGFISLEPGTYRISGLSAVTMQTTFAPPKPLNNNNYPGYCLLYPKSAEADGPAIVKKAIAIGTPQTALDMAPSIFDVIYTVTTRTEIAVGHQSGEDLHDEVYLSVYDVEGMKSDYHLFARITITKM